MREGARPSGRDYKVKRYAFCFARNLTTGQEKTFVKRLVSRHPGVKVDYWNKSELGARLLDGPAGARVEHLFFGDRDREARVERHLRAGGVLNTSEDAAERGLELAKFQSERDPYFSYPMVQGEVDEPTPPPTPGRMMSVERIRDGLFNRTDVVPRHPEAMDRYGPKGRFLFSDDEDGRRAREWIHAAITEGCQVEVDSGIEVEFDRLPPAFSDVVGKPIKGKVTLQGRRQPMPWRARAIVRTDRGSREIDLNLLSVEPTPGWDAELAGSFGGLTLALRFRWRHHESRGESNLHWSHRLDLSPAREQLAALRLLDALHGEGTLLLQDRDDGDRALEEPLDAQETPEEMLALLSFLGDVVTIEERTGTTLPIPPQGITSADIFDVARIATTIREGGHSAHFTSVRGVFESGHEILRRKTLTGVEIRHKLDARVLGQIVELGSTLTKLPPLRVAEQHDDPQSGQLEATLVPDANESAEIWIELVDEDEQQAA